MRHGYYKTSIFILQENRLTLASSNQDIAQNSATNAKSWDTRRSRVQNYESVQDAQRYDTTTASAKR